MVEREFKWVCNCCGNSVNKPEYGMPAEWKWYIGREGVSHACFLCTRKMEENDWKQNPKNTRQLIKK